MRKGALQKPSRSVRERGRRRGGSARAPRQGRREGAIGTQLSWVGRSSPGAEGWRARAGRRRRRSRRGVGVESRLFWGLMAERRRGGLVWGCALCWEEERHRRRPHRESERGDEKSAVVRGKGAAGGGGGKKKGGERRERAAFSPPPGETLPRPPSRGGVKREQETPEPRDNQTSRVCPNPSVYLFQANQFRTDHLDV